MTVSSLVPLLPKAWLKGRQAGVSLILAFVLCISIPGCGGNVEREARAEQAALAAEQAADQAAEQAEIQRQRIEEATREFIENRESILADMTAVEALVNREEWDQARSATTELKTRLAFILLLEARRKSRLEQRPDEYVAETAPGVADLTVRLEDADRAILNCNLTGAWTSVLYQLPGQPAVTDRLTLVNDGGNRYTVVMTYDDGSTLRESAIRDGCTLNETVEGNRYVVRENGDIGLSDRDGFIRLYRPQ